MVGKNAVNTRVFIQQIKINPQIEGLYRDFASFKLSGGDLNGAADLVEKAKEDLPLEILNDPEAIPGRQQEIRNELLHLYEISGQINAQQGKLAEAREAYLEVLKINPFYFPIYKKVADTYYQSAKAACDMHEPHHQAGARQN